VYRGSLSPTSSAESAQSLTFVLLTPKSLHSLFCQAIDVVNAPQSGFGRMPESFAALSLLSAMFCVCQRTDLTVELKMEIFVFMLIFVEVLTFFNITKAVNCITNIKHDHLKFFYVISLQNCMFSRILR
jgi:hypothetical protein